MGDDLGDRMKKIEMIEAGRILILRQSFYETYNVYKLL